MSEASPIESEPSEASCKNNSFLVTREGGVSDRTINKELRSEERAVNNSFCPDKWRVLLVQEPGTIGCEASPIEKVRSAVNKLLPS